MNTPPIFQNEGFRLTAHGIEVLPRAVLAMAGEGPEEDLQLVGVWFEELKQFVARSQ